MPIGTLLAAAQLAPFAIDAGKGLYNWFTNANEEQYDQAKDIASQQAAQRRNRYNLSSAAGNVRWVMGPDGQLTMQEELSPEQQKIREAQAKLVNQLTAAQGEDFDKNTYVLNQQKALADRINKRREEVSTDLMARGFGPGSSEYRNAMSDLDKTESEAFDSTYAQAQEKAHLMNAQKQQNLLGAMGALGQQRQSALNQMNPAFMGNSKSTYDTHMQHLMAQREADVQRSAQMQNALMSGIGNIGNMYMQNKQMNQGGLQFNRNLEFQERLHNANRESNERLANANLEFQKMQMNNQLGQFKDQQKEQKKQKRAGMWKDIGTGVVQLATGILTGNPVGAVGGVGSIGKGIFGGGGGGGGGKLTFNAGNMRANLGSLNNSINNIGRGLGNFASNLGGGLNTMVGANLGSLNNSVNNALNSLGIRNYINR